MRRFVEQIIRPTGLVDPEVEVRPVEGQVDDLLDEKVLTVGFARRFATYKRGNLFLRDPQRLLHMLRDTQRPLQFIIAGKAHPADGGGKERNEDQRKEAGHVGKGAWEKRRVGARALRSQGDRSEHPYVHLQSSRSM